MGGDVMLLLRSRGYVEITESYDGVQAWAR